MEILFNLLHDLLYFLSQSNLLFDAILVGLGVAAARLPQFVIFIRAAILITQALKWYLKHHPVGKRHAEKTNIDEHVAALEKDIKHHPNTLGVMVYVKLIVIAILLAILILAVLHLIHILFT